MRLVRKPDQGDGWYEFTPAEASLLLDKGHKNRPLREARAAEIADEIRASKWEENGESLVLDKNGRLMDGQHRLRACVLANKPITAYVVHLPAVTPGTFDSMDSGKPRSAADRLALDDVPRYTLCAAMVRLLLGYENGVKSGTDATTRQKRFTRADIRLRRQRDLDRVDTATEAAQGVSEGLSGMSPLSIAAFVYYMAAKEDEDKAMKFLRGVALGENLARTNPALLLRNRLIQQATSKAKLPGREMLALWIKAWCAYRDQKVPKQLKWDSRQEFPRFTDKAA